jgi:acetyl-CoA carboxylase biotin carboxyl carrier protein
MSAEQQQPAAAEPGAELEPAETAAAAELVPVMAEPAVNPQPAVAAARSGSASEAAPTDPETEAGPKDGSPAAPSPASGDDQPLTGVPASTGDPGDASLLGLIDRLTVLLERSELSELEVRVGATGLVLRKPSALPAASAVPGAAAQPAGGEDLQTGSAGEAPAEAPPAERPSVKAPLTGFWYASPSPGSAPYVTPGGEVAVGQVIGLIEAMKLFNEIKSDLSGRVVKIHAEDGKLVKAKQPLIEVEPL